MAYPFVLVFVILKPKFNQQMAKSFDKQSRKL